MEMTDKIRFAQALVATAELYGKEISKGLAELYFQDLAAYPIDDVLTALTRHRRDPTRGQYWPKPADLIRQLDGDPESRAMQAWTTVWQAVGRVGTYQTVVFDDPLIHAVVEEMGGWLAFGQFTEEEQPFRAQEFVKRYRAYQASRRRPPYPPKLIGRTEHTNATAGFTEAIPPPVLLGDPAQARQVQAQGVHGGGQLQITRTDMPAKPLAAKAIAPAEREAV